MTKHETTIKKQVDFAFGKKVYLLGADEKGVKYWLEAPSWDCGWYWGFGYIETYRGNGTPSKAIDIASHQHAEGFYNIWCYEILKNKTFSDDEKWALCELFDNFYTLKKLAGAQHANGKEGNYTRQRNGFNYNDLIKENININIDCLPSVMAKIVSILGGGDVEELEEQYKKQIQQR